MTSLDESDDFSDSLLDTPEWDVHFNCGIGSLVLTVMATLCVYVFFRCHFSMSVLNQNFTPTDPYDDIIMHTAHPKVVPTPVYEPIPEYVPMAMDPEDEDPSKEEDPSEGVDDPITNWNIDSKSSFYYSDSSAPSSRGSRISTRGRGCGRGRRCRF